MKVKFTHHYWQVCKNCDNRMLMNVQSFDSGTAVAVMQDRPCPVCGKYDYDVEVKTLKNNIYEFVKEMPALRGTFDDEK